MTERKRERETAIIINPKAVETGDGTEEKGHQTKGFPEAQGRKSIDN